MLIKFDCASGSLKEHVITQMAAPQSQILQLSRHGIQDSVDRAWGLKTRFSSVPYDTDAADQNLASGTS